MLILFRDPLIVRIPSREELGMPPLVRAGSQPTAFCNACAKAMFDGDVDVAAVLAAPVVRRKERDTSHRLRPLPADRGKSIPRRPLLPTESSDAA